MKKLTVSRHRPFSFLDKFRLFDSPLIVIIVVDPILTDHHS